MIDIHPTAIIGKNVEIGNNVKIGPYVIIEDNVIIGDDCTVDSHTTIHSFVKMGKENHIYSHVDLGGLPQDIHFSGEETWVEIGDNNHIREFATIHRATSTERKTVIGNNNYLMAYSHIAHDSIVGNNVIFVNYSGIAGHVEIEDNVILSGHVMVHQFCKIGKLAMLGGGAKITQDIMPFSLVAGDPANVYGLNVVGLRRNGISKEARFALKSVLSIVLEGGNKETVIKKIERLPSSNLEEVQHVIEFIKKSERGILRRKHG